MQRLSSDEIFQDYLLLYGNSRRKSRSAFMRELLKYVVSKNIKYKQLGNGAIELVEY